MTAAVSHPALTFDEATHRYRLDGRVVPSVTQVLHAAGLIDDRFFTQQSRDRGRVVHKMIMYEEREGLDSSSVDPRLAGYLAAYRKFIREVQPGPCLLIEQPLVSVRYGFAGTPDQFRVFPVRKRPSLPDLKSGIKSRAHALQTAAYEQLIRENAPWLGLDEPGLIDRYAIYLKPVGEYRLERFEERRDWRDFLAALRIANLKGTVR